MKSMGGGGTAGPTGAAGAGDVVAAAANTFTVAPQQITSDNAGHKVLILKAAATPTADILEAQTSAAAIPWRVDKDGYMVIKLNAAPADAAIAAGEAALWFDSTNGAGKLMVKAKTANGTVATGSVTLS